jgi:hypothetical protein
MTAPARAFTAGIAASLLSVGAFGCDASHCSEGGGVTVRFSRPLAIGSHVTLTLADRRLETDCPGRVAIEPPGYVWCQAGEIVALVPKLPITSIDTTILTVQDPTGQIVVDEVRVPLGKYDWEEDGNIGWCTRDGEEP